MAAHEETVAEGEYIDERGRWLLEESAARGQQLTPLDVVADYAVWLLKVRDKLSWHQIAYRIFPFATEPHKEGYESRVRRMFNRVEKSHPGSKSFKRTPLSKEDKMTLQAIMLGVVPIYIRTEI